MVGRHVDHQLSCVADTLSLGGNSNPNTPVISIPIGTKWTLAAILAYFPFFRNSALSAMQLDHQRS